MFQKSTRTLAVLFMLSLFATGGLAQGGRRCGEEQKEHRQLHAAS